MNSETVLDFAQFQLSPQRTRCELVVYGDGKSEKLASGFLKPFLTHLKVAEEQAGRCGQSIKLEVERRRNGGTWFNKGTLERFVRFVSTPEVLELVNTFDAEMSQLEGARKIYSQGVGDQLSGENKPGAAAAADITKKELLKAIDVRLSAVQQDLATACARASAAGFTLDTASELLLFADRFGAPRLNEACAKFISLWQRRPELIIHQRPPPPLLPTQWKSFDDANIRSSSGSDMSIDDPEVETAGPSRSFSKSVSDSRPEPHKSTNLQTYQKSNVETKHGAPTLTEDTRKSKEEPPPSVTPAAEPVQPSGGGSRRLSVQDRINLFESKQKEQSASSTIGTGSSSGGGLTRVVSVKGEHRRLSSDVSMEKSVLRRWSGASDMSIDVNNSFGSDRKETGSAAETPPSSDYSQFQSESKTEDRESGVLKDTATSRPRLGPKENSTNISSSAFSSSLVQSQSFSKDSNQPKPNDAVSTISKARSQPTLGPKENSTNISSSAFSSSLVQSQSFSKDSNQPNDAVSTMSKAQSGPSLEKGTPFGSSMGGANQDGFNYETVSKASSRPAPEPGHPAVLKDNSMPVNQFSGIADQTDGVKYQTSSNIRSKALPAIPASELKAQATGNVTGVKSEALSKTKLRTFAGNAEDSGARLKVPFDSQFQARPSFRGNTEQASREEVGIKEAAASVNMPSKASLEDERKSVPDQIKKVQGNRDDRIPTQGTTAPVMSSKKAKESVKVLQTPSKPSMEQAQAVRPSKGNNELNDELQVKADELEKLFAAHKLRVQGDQASSSWRSKTISSQALKPVERSPAEVPTDHTFEVNVPNESLSNGVEFDSSLLLKMVHNLDSANSMKQKLGTLTPQDDSRGKLYEKYMQKRDAKLREEWGSQRAQKEANLKAMRDSLERRQAEMKAKFGRSADKQNSEYAHHRAEKLRSFNVCSSIKNKGQTLDFLQSEEVDVHELEQVIYSHDRYHSDTLSGNESSTSSKKLATTRNLPSSTPRTPAAPIPKPSAKPTNSNSIHRRDTPENSLAQSVPNFSDFRKENTKPVAGIVKVASRAQSRTIPRSKSNTEEPVNLAKEEKSRRSHAMRKSLAIPSELKDLSPLNSDGTNLTSLKFQKEQMNQFVNKIHKGGESKPFLRKGSDTGVGIFRQKTAFMDFDALKDEEDSEGLVDEEDPVDIIKENPEEFPVDPDSENGSDNGDVLRSLSQDVDDTIAESSKFNPSMENVQESPGESPGSWTSNIHHSFSYANQASDVDASVDSPTESPASWNSHPLNQMMEADAARMRKKWGSAQVPVLVASAPQQSRKDVTKGFKRLLKFGRKSRCAEYLTNDWVSASTASEGDDDTEDGRELGARSSDDLRKSRMGYATPVSYDGFNGGDFPEQVQSLQSSIPNAPANFKLREDHLSGSSLKAPRSFFSLSSFRSKGSEAKPR